MSNDFSSRLNLQLIEAAQTLVNVAGETPAAFGLSAAEISALTSSATLLGNAVQELATRRASLDEAIADKDLARAKILTALSQAARSVYSDAALTDVQIRSLGLSPRRSGGVRPQALFAPTNLVAKGYSDSTIRLSWDRGASNIRGTTFQIFGSTDGLAYEMIDTTTQASIVLSGYAPGSAAWFKISAKRSGLVSTMSDAASVYAPGAPAAVKLKVA